MSGRIVSEATTEGVAREFVATKLALRELIASALGGQDFYIDGLDEWAQQSPVNLSYTEDQITEQSLRVDAIQHSMMRAIGEHFLAQANRS